jgi:hypothetical protein
MLERLLHRFSVRVWQWLILAGGVVFRLAFFARDGWEPILRGESVLVAISIVQKGTFANAFGENSGPTAHVMPLYPLFQALLIRIFGTGPEARFAVAFFSSSVACLAFALFPVLSKRAGLGLYTGVLGGLIGAFLPLNFFSQTEGSFETSYTFLSIVLLMSLWMKVWKDGKLTVGRAVLCGAAVAIAVLTSAVLIPVIACWLLLPFAVTILPAGRRADWLRFVAVLAVTAGILYAPWVIRNRIVLGHAVFTRTNLGLELLRSNNDFVVANADTDIYMKAYQDLGPFQNVDERAKVLALGEVEYNAAKMQAAKDWISAHKRHFIALTLQRIRNFWFPSMARAWQTAGEILVTILGFCGIAWGLRRPDRQLAILSLTAAIVYPLPYYLLANNARFRFPLEGVLIFWIGAWLIALLSRSDEWKTPQR